MSAARDTVLLVCSGNTCRSPMAAALLRAALAKEGGRLAALRVESRGLAALAGSPASTNAVRAMKAIGLGLEGHSSQPLAQGDVDRAVLVLTMGTGHLRALRGGFANLPAETALFRGHLPEGQGREIPDPFGGDLAVYQDCRDSMVEALPGILAMLRTRLA